MSGAHGFQDSIADEWSATRKLRLLLESDSQIKVCPSSGNELLPYLSELCDSLRSTGLLLPLPAHLHRLCFGITGLRGRALDVDRTLGIDFNIAIEVLLVRIFKHFVLKPIFGHTLTCPRLCPQALSVSMLLKSRFA